MPTIPRSKRTAQIGDAPASSTFSSATFEQFGQELRNLAAQKKRNADAVIAGKKQKADYAWIVGKMGDVQSKFAKQRTTLERMYCAHSIEYAEAFSRFTQDYGQELISQAPDEETRFRFGSQYSNLQDTAVKAVWKERDDAFKAKKSAKLTNDLSMFSTLSSQDFNNWELHFDGGMQSLDRASVSFLTSKEYQDHVVGFQKNIAKSTISGFYRSQPDKLSVATALSDGTFGEMYPEFEPLYSYLPEESRAQMAQNLLEEYNRTVRFEERVEKKRDERSKDLFGRTVIEFFLTDPDDLLAQGSLFDSVKYSKFMNHELLRKMQDRMNGVGDPDVDNPLALFQLRTEIQNKVITSAQEIASRIGSGLSATTARTEMLPLLRSMTDVRFQSARRYLMAELGLPDGMIVLDPNEPKREEARSLAQLETYYQNNPEGDFEGEARRIIENFQKEASAKDQAALQTIEQALKEVNDKLALDPNNETLLKSLHNLTSRKTVIENRKNNGRP